MNARTNLSNTPRHGRIVPSFVAAFSLLATAAMAARPTPGTPAKGINVFHTGGVTGVVRSVQCIRNKRDGMIWDVLEIRTRDGKAYEVRSSATPWITRGGKRIGHGQVKKGDTVFAKGHPMGRMLHADEPIVEAPAKK